MVKERALCHVFESSDDQWFMSTSSFSLRSRVSTCPFACHFSLPFCAHGRSRGAVRLAWYVLNAVFVRNLLARMRDAVVHPESSASD